MPKLKMFGWNLFVQSSSKVVRVLKVRHPPGHLSSLSPLHLWSPTWSTTRLRRWYSAFKFSASFPLVHCCTRLSVGMLINKKRQRSTTAPQVTSVALVSAYSLAWHCVNVVARAVVRMFFLICIFFFNFLSSSFLYCLQLFPCLLSTITPIPSHQVSSIALLANISGQSQSNHTLSSTPS